MVDSRSPNVNKKNIPQEDLDRLERIVIANECRLSVLKFAYEMERILRLNDYKGGWEDCSFYYLKSRLVEEMGEYFRADYEVDSKPETKQKALNELVDIANFCMMLHELRQSVEVRD